MSTVTLKNKVAMPQLGSYSVWRALERLYKENVIGAIGICNFCWRIHP